MSDKSKREKAIADAEWFLRKDALAYANLKVFGRVQSDDGWILPFPSEAANLLEKIYTPRLKEAAERLLAALAMDDSA